MKRVLAAVIACLVTCVWLQALFPKTDVTKLAYTGKIKSDFANLVQVCAKEAAGAAN